MNTFWDSISDNGHFIIEENKTNFFLRVILFYLNKLWFDSTKNTLPSGHKSLVIVVLPWKIIELSFISWLHELSQHFYFFLRNSKFKVYFTLERAGSVHAARDIDAENNCGIVFTFTHLEGTLKHIDYIVLDWNFLFFNHKGIGVTTKFTIPETLFRFQLIFGISLVSRYNRRVFVKNRSALFTLVRISAC